MISAEFYKKGNLVKQFLNRAVFHYGVKSPSITLSWYDYIIKRGDTLYILASRIFGEGMDHLWTLIADNNPPRQPDDWRVGEIIRLPKIIIKETDSIQQIYSDATTTSTTV